MYSYLPYYFMFFFSPPCYCVVLMLHTGYYATTIDIDPSGVSALGAMSMPTYFKVLLNNFFLPWLGLGT